jgi:hypothetical protein
MEFHRVELPFALEYILIESQWAGTQRCAGQILGEWWSLGPFFSLVAAQALAYCILWHGAQRRQNSQTIL